MNTLLHISTNINHPALLQHMVERLAQRRNDFSCNENATTGSWQPLTSSSVEAYLEGSNLFKEEGQSCRSSFTSSFLFTCLKQTKNSYKLTWCVSLS